MRQGFTLCDGAWFDEHDQASRRAGIGRTSSDGSAAGLHGVRRTTPARLSGKRGHRALTLGVESSEITFDVGPAEELLAHAAAVEAMADLVGGDGVRFYPAVSVLAVMFPTTALAAHVRNELGDPPLDLRIYEIREDVEAVLRAFDDHGMQATRAACEHDARGWAIEAHESPGWSFRRSTVALPASCTDEVSDLQLFVRRTGNTSLVLACVDADACGDIARSFHARAIRSVH